MEGKLEIVRKKSISAHILVGLIRVYQYLTPWMNCCRFYPSCSKYSVEAIEKHGAIVGVILTVYRLLRCQPYCKGGFDPVPEKIRFKVKLKKEFKGENV